MGASLLHSSLRFSIGRIVSGVVTLGAIGVFTRLLGPAEYGRYALIVAGVAIVDMVLFQWIRLSLARWLPAHHIDTKELKGLIVGIYAGVLGLVALPGLLAVMFWPTAEWRGLILLGFFLLPAQAWFEINQELHRAQLNHRRYSNGATAKAIVSLCLGSLLVYAGFSSYGPLVGLLVGYLLASTVGWQEWQHVSPRSVLSWAAVKPLLQYGLPFIGSIALGYIVESSDRFMLVWLADESVAGIYSAGYDLAWQILGFLGATISLPAFPMAVKAMNDGSGVSVRRTLQNNFTLLLGVCAPATAGLACIAVPLSGLVLGEPFRDVSAILPVVALAQLFFNLRVHHTDLAFKLSGHTAQQVWIAAISALVNVVLNVLLIPGLGMLGAALGTLAAYAVALGISSVVGRRFISVPIIYSDSLKILASTGLMVLVLVASSSDWATRDPATALILSIVLGAMTYGLGIWLLNVAGVRARLRAAHIKRGRA